MRDLHFDGGFMRDFNAASEQWSWASWHEIRAAQNAVAERLLEQVFGAGEELRSLTEPTSEPEE